MLRRVLSALGRSLAVRASAREWHALAAGPEPRVAAVARALLRATRAPANGDERNALDGVQALRTRMLKSDDRLEVVDHGAGSPDACRTPEEMARGVVTTVQVGEVARTATTPHRLGCLMFALVRELVPMRALELGTNLGIGAAYIGQGLRLNGQGELHTIEGAASLAHLARTNMAWSGLHQVHIHQGRFDVVLPQLLAASGPFDLVFIDGHHDHDATLDYFDTIHPHLAPGAVVIFDDIGWSDGMSRAWRRLCADPRTGRTIDIGRWGIACIGAASSGPGPHHLFRSFP